MATDGTETGAEPGDGEFTRVTGQVGVTSGRGPPRLESTLVRYEDGPDRRTIYPPGLSSLARMSTWISADADAYHPLDEMR